ncbi:MAG: hypothetical protein ACXVKH_09955 [Candidatus Angelobacter sp.]
MPDVTLRMAGQPFVFAAYWNHQALGAWVNVTKRNGARVVGNVEDGESAIGRTVRASVWVHLLQVDLLQGRVPDDSCIAKYTLSLVFDMRLKAAGGKVEFNHCTSDLREQSRQSKSWPPPLAAFEVITEEIENRVFIR